MQMQPSATPITELTDVPAWDDFYRDFVHANKPCVFRGHTAKLQSAFQKWTDDYLVERFSKMQVTAELWKSEFRDGPRVEMTFKKFAKAIYSKKHADQLYAVIPFEEDPIAKSDFILPPPIRCKEVLPQSLTLWMSAGGTTSVLHEDDGENFLMLLAGKKEVMLVHQDHAQHLYAHAAKFQGTSPVFQDSVDHEKFPDFQHVQWHKVTLEAGDTLYIPHSFWHQVNSFGRNLAVNFWWGHREDWRWWNPSNESEYDVRRFGAKGSIPFDELKGRGPDKMPCTPLAEGETMEGVKFVDEGQYKNYLSKKRKKEAKQARAKRSEL
mmetsp:Transcript_94552/g.164047  ORF Transcript_94552/g.164047 Transcript_94552/m.164047 type:complete len:323 (+) Transcript_94552:1-969(+)